MVVLTYKVNWFSNLTRKKISVAQPWIQACLLKISGTIENNISFETPKTRLTVVVERI